jgi:hypothetical protein
LKPSGEAQAGVRKATATGHRYALAITAVDTGAWRASHRMEVEGLTGRVFIAPEAANPRSGTRVSRYQSVWEERGGRLAAYERTVNEAGDKIMRDLEGSIDVAIE